MSASSYKKAENFRPSKPDQAESELKREFVQTIGDEMFVELEKIADEKGIRVQTLLRAVIIPEWVQGKGLPMNHRSSPISAQTASRERRREDRSQKF